MHVDARDATHAGLVGWLALTSLVVAASQSVVITFSAGSSTVHYFDDVLVGLLVVAALFRASTAPGLPIYLLGAWATLMLVAAARSSVDLTATFLLFRQVTIPALLILAGLTLTAREWRLVSRLAVVVGLLNVGYMAVEVFGIRLLDPVPLARYNVSVNQMPVSIWEDLPGYYRYYLGSEPVTRLGGLLLNPPIAGMVTATALVILWHDRKFPMRRTALVLLAGATVLTFSRGGLLVALVGLGLPFLLRKLGILGVVVLGPPALFLSGLLLVGVGKSQTHLEGLFSGLYVAVTNPVGAGFGSTGNYLKGRSLATSGESLAGIAFSAAGLLAVALLITLVVALVYATRRGIWEGALGLGVVLAAMLAETAGALNGTIALWLAVGVALRLLTPTVPGSSRSSFGRERPKTAYGLQPMALDTSLEAAAGYSHRTDVAVELRDYVRIAHRRWPVILGCVIAAVGIASLILMTATPRYDSTTRLFVSTSASDNTEAYQGSLFLEQRVTSYADLAAGPELAGRVIERLDLDMAPEELATRIAADVEPDTVILGITVSDASPQRAQRIAEAAALELRALINQLENFPGRTGDPVRATIVEEASLPATAAFPRPARDLGLAAIFGLVVGVGVTVLLEVLDTTVRSPATVSERTGLAVVGAIPYDSGAARHPLLTTLEATAPRAEAFRVLRSNLQFHDVVKDSKVFVVTSSVPGEGKTSTATNLAISFAQAGQSVLLLEGDLRRPKVPELLHVDHAKGLTPVLTGALAFTEAVQATSIPNLSLLGGHDHPPNPAELLQSPAMPEILSRARRIFDVVIVNAPPVLPVADAAVLTALSDGALFVVRHGRTTIGRLVQSIQSLEAVDGRVVGVVLNMTRRESSSSDHRDYGYGEQVRTDGHGHRARPVAGTTPGMHKGANAPTHPGRRLH